LGLFYNKNLQCKVASYLVRSSLRLVKFHDKLHHIHLRKLFRLYTTKYVIFIYNLYFVFIFYLARTLRSNV